jgi:hypothetical protein
VAVQLLGLVQLQVAVQLQGVVRLLLTLTTLLALEVVAWLFKFAGVLVRVLALKLLLQPPY